MRRHLCVNLAGPEAGQIERWRHEWDPVMASVIPAHVTVTYPEETVDEALLLQRAELCHHQTPAFRLRLGEVFTEDEGRGGVFVAVDDVDRGWADLRRGLLSPPMTPISFPAHVTIAHPRTCRRGPQCYAELAGHCARGTVWARELLFTQTTANSFTVLRRFPLSAGAND
ncbi:2'-5' RNA ligase family protein [Streptomyces sp. NPDC058297]|uniref:2'-5' RNA ligase family protein n=1 Tax=Streptomyces sp. NPDC058297 TaxID=3346433 RepID=UPI0036E8CE92